MRCRTIFCYFCELQGLIAYYFLILMLIYIFSNHLSGFWSLVLFLLALMCCVYLHVWHQTSSPQRLKDLEVLLVLAPDPSRTLPISTLVDHEEPTCCHHLCLRKALSLLVADGILICDRFCQVCKTLIIMHCNMEIKLSLVCKLKDMSVKEC